MEVAASWDGEMAFWEVVGTVFGAFADDGVLGRMSCCNHPAGTRHCRDLCAIDGEVNGGLVSCFDSLSSGSKVIGIKAAV